MKNKKQIMEMAKDFTDIGSCMIHAEMRNGGNVERIISGDLISMLNCVAAIVDRISSKTGQDFAHTLSAINGIKMIGYKQVLKDLYGKDFVSEDSCEEERKEYERAIRQSVANEIDDAIIMIRDLENKCKNKDEQIKLINDSYSRLMKSKDAQIKELSKECKSLEHRLDEMEKRNTLCFDLNCE